MMKTKQTRRKNNIYEKLSKKKKLLTEQALNYLLDNDINMNTKVAIFRDFGHLSYEYENTGIKRLDYIVKDVQNFEYLVDIVKIIESDVYSEAYDYLSAKYDISINTIIPIHKNLDEYFHSVCIRYVNSIYNYLFRKKYYYSKVII